MIEYLEEKYSIIEANYDADIYNYFKRSRWLFHS